ncbi:undecaprenyl-diphosphate phosphatase [Paenibacillus validus]|uniref:Undecaprenyl-diphosphatase n=1 Tax=Paenibacillus validus TaxID=44253 RepID=A0A7X2ZDC4_9BACL|nr:MULTISPECIES: undecaprenyl-diphosphate phosphatase [Paenibacillus]MED4601557.1 undecaprenyl-diphosphate phosphatase [Paenibacillus validus]MED4608175.1 undecaprenyl-diphosphate phosphatase [Paenibacillus validus]MUG72061.1 undecaprenyl-diphosphate phosphatase [Paenibacillus validus]
MNDFWSAVILGIVEGLTEFLPVSSTGHMILTAHLIGFTGEKAKTFEIVVQLGAVLAVFVLYWRRFFGFLNLKRSLSNSGRVNLIHIALAMLPAVVVGLALHDLVKKYLFGPGTVLISLVAGGILIIIADRARVRVTAETMDDITYKQAFGIGLFQCLALWPGFSRSGSTISGGILLGTSQKAAAEFTFIVSVPIMFAATFLDLYKSRDLLSMDDLGLFVTGLAASFIVAMIAVVTFLNIIKRLSLSWFAYYRFVLAIVFYLILFL